MPGRSQSVAEQRRKTSIEDERVTKSAQAPPASKTRPPRTPLSTKKLRKRSLISASLSDAPSERDVLPPPKPAWEQFAEHIKTFSVVGRTYSTPNSESFNFSSSAVNATGSDLCKKILKDMKDQLEKKRAKELLILQRQQEMEASTKQCEMESLSDDSDYYDSDDEESEEKRQKKVKAEALRYWGIIRRDVQERIRIRKEKNPAGGTWNALRSQLRALTRANNVRQELYEKYGIVPKPGTKVAEDSMKPKLSVDLKEVVNRFQSFQVRKLKVTFA